MNIDGPLLTGAAAVITAVGGGIGVIFGRRTKKEKNAVDGLNTVIEQQAALLDRQGGLIARSEERLDVVEGELADVRTEVADIQHERFVDQLWIELLRDHINRGLPPPPPERPSIPRVHNLKEDQK